MRGARSTRHARAARLQNLHCRLDAPNAVQLVTDLGQGDDLTQTATSFLNDFLVPSIANSRPAPLSRLLRDEQTSPLATKSQHVRRLAAAKQKLFGGAV